MNKSFHAVLAATIVSAALVSTSRARTQTVSEPAKMGMNDTSAVLRGYGKIHLTSHQEKDCTVWKMEATSATNASTTAGKFLADLNLSPEVTVGTLDVNGKSFPLTTVPGGAVYTGFVSDKTGYVISASDEAALKSYLAGNAKGGVVIDLKYPPYLDRFDRHGWGFYGFNGLWTKPKPNDVHETDPLEDMKFLAKYNFRFELWPQPGDFDDNYSVPERHSHGWLLSEAGQLGVPVSARLYGNLPPVKEFTDLRDVEQPFMAGGWYWSVLGYRDWPRQSWFSPQGRLYMARQAQDEIKLYAKHPEIESWMMPYGEIGTYDWYIYHGDISPAAVNDWHATIRNKLHLSLAGLSAMYHRQDHPFKSYDEVNIPEVATFEGLPGMIQDLEGDWYVRPESQPGEGLAGQWWNADVKSADWDRMHMPGSVYWFKYTKVMADQPKWVIRDFDFDAGKVAAGKPVYLYDFARAVNDDGRKTGLVYLNGQRIGVPSSWGAWDVTPLLKSGANRLALQTDIFGGRVFLSTEKPALYPYLGADRNRLWIIFNQWLRDGRYAACNTALAAMREVEPNKPIKIMAPPPDTSDSWLDMGSRFGAWGHFTGEGMWAFFWYKRYGFLYGLPGTSEGGGPMDDIASQYNLVQRVFLEGLNGHDQVFTVQHVTGLAALKDYYENHMALLKQMGRYDIAGPQVILYRSTNEATHLMRPPIPPLDSSMTSVHDSHEIQTVWNWDFARGTFQSIGQSGLYVDDGGIASGKIASYLLMMDDGNEILTPEAIKNLGDWIRQGGTYITLPFTGRSEPSAPDSWPIQAITGCQVGKLRTPGPGKGAVTIAQNQPLFKELAGKTFPDDGTDREQQGFEHDFLSTELKPGPDCQVVATFEDGAPAIVVHKLGRGRVVVLGSTFFNHIADLKGLWLPDELGSAFFRDLFTQLGFPSVNYATDQKVLVQRYRTNNGLDDVMVANNFTGADRTVDFHVTLDRKPEKAYQVAMNEVREIPFTVDGNKVILSKIAIPKDEVQVFYFRTHSSGDAMGHWWDYQKKLWKPTDPVKVDMAPIARGRFIDKALDLKTDWHWTQNAPTDDAWMKAGFDDRKWQHWVLDVFNAVGADPVKPVYARKIFEVTPAWLKDGGITKLVAVGSSWNFASSDGRWELQLNGRLLKKEGFLNPDVSALLRPGGNVLTLKLEAPKNGNYIGVLGACYLTHARLPAKTLNLAGMWNANPPGMGDAKDGAGRSFQFPGKASAFAPTRTIDLPADWKSKYIVTYYAKGTRTSVIGAIVNETGVIRRQQHLNGDEVEVDITPFLHFGTTNTLSMLSTAGHALEASRDWDISAVELRCYPRSEYR